MVWEAVFDDELSQTLAFLFHLVAELGLELSKDDLDAFQVYTSEVGAIDCSHDTSHAQ